LLFYTHGAYSQHVSSRIAQHTSTSGGPRKEFASITLSSDPNVFAELHAFFQPYLRLLPNYSESASSSSPADVCTPLAILSTNWTADPLAGHGSYTNFQVGGERLDEDVKVLRRGLPERRVWFAGEHTAPFVALGTVTGAWWAGEAVGKRIGRVYGLSDSESKK